MSSPDEEPYGLVPLALNNDHHFWGVASTGVEKGPISDKLIEIEVWVRLPQACSDRNRSCDNEDDDDDDITVRSRADRKASSGGVVSRC